jgi:hydroxyethylthiazole kinase
MTASMRTPGRTLTALRERGPLVHNITNLVAMDMTANLLLAAGASPLMAHAREELAEVVAAADALTVNIGTLSLSWVETMAQAAQAASDGGTPWVLDPVGAGATAYRTESAARLVALGPTAIRGNGSEIMALADAASGARPRGVDTSVESVEALDAAFQLARQSGACVAVTGAVDYVTDGVNMTAVANGVPLMGRVTAMGCALSSLVAACLAVTHRPRDAVAHALAILGVSGEIAAQESDGPGSLRWRLLDAIYDLDPDNLNAMARIQE